MRRPSGGSGAGLLRNPRSFCSYACTRWLGMQKTANSGAWSAATKLQADAKFKSTYWTTT